MDRLKIFVINNVGDSDFIGSTYIDVASVLAFLRRQRHIHHFSIIAIKGKRSLYIEKIDSLNTAKDLINFQNQM